ncbi:MAG: hypothetical protein JST19_01505 [Bacteroidetes bacterium]|nr:hypothetical protein [Bacteroidota bacterium]
MTVLALNACRHAGNPEVSTSGGGSSATGGALPAVTSDSIQMSAHPKSPAAADTLNKGLKTDSVKKNP